MQNRTTNQQNYWDREAETYIKRYRLESPNARRKIERKAHMIMAGAGITVESEVLEIGCGVGIFTRKLAKTGAKIISLDISPAMIEAAKNNPIISVSEPNVTYIVSDIHKTWFKDNQFDAVVGCYILQYLDLTIALPEIMRILKPGGRVAFIDINTLNPIAFLKTKMPATKRLMNISKEAVSFTSWELPSWFEQYGFTEIQCTTFEFGYPPLNLFEYVPFIRHFAGNLLVIAKKSFG